ncbi:hypothetical protein DFJ73DRAFT_229269 [Zopfochytrium polystomum]|nr:hypothetical protein DFJ73DRAFT_229269 [Zopfochytrium polystomum]
MPLSLGQALAELLATPETELRSACEDVLGGAKGLQRHHAALKRLDEEIERRSTKGFMEILNPLIDKILRTEAAMRSRSLILTSFLLRSANGPIVAKALITLLEAQDKRTKLAVVLLLEFFTSEMKLFVSKLQRGGWSPDKEEPGRSKPWVLLTLFWDGLVRILRQDGVFDDKQSARVETRLTTLTVHVAMEVLLLWCDAGSGNSCMGKAISSLDAGDTEEYETSDSFVITPEMIVDLLETLKLYRANSPLFCSTVDSAKAFVESSQIPIPMFKNMIKSLVRGAHPSVGLMALANFTSLLHKILSPSSDDASGGYFKLLGAAFAVGQRSKEDIDDILSSNPELEKAVLQLASLLVGECTKVLL